MRCVLFHMKKVWRLSCSLRTPMALVRYMRRIWPSIAKFLHNAVRHNFPNVINHTPEVLFPRKVGGVFPQPTVFQSSPESLVIIAAFGVIRYPCRTATHRLECRKADTRRLQAESTRPNIDVFFSPDSTVGCCSAGGGTSPDVFLRGKRRTGVGGVGSSSRGTAKRLRPGNK